MYDPCVTALSQSLEEILKMIDAHRAYLGKLRVPDDAVQADAGSDPRRGPIHPDRHGAV